MNLLMFAKSLITMKKKFNFTTKEKGVQMQSRQNHTYVSPEEHIKEFLSKSHSQWVNGIILKQTFFYGFHSL